MTQKLEVTPAATRSPYIQHAVHDSQWQAAVHEWRTNWRVGLAAFLAIGLSYGAFQGISSLFILPLQETFGWSRTQIVLSHYASLALAIIAPFAGRLIDRFGARYIMLWGMSLSAIAYVALAAMNGSLAVFYTLMIMSAVCGLSSSGLTCSRVISETFVRSRGLSLAIARSGLALASAALPILLFTVISRFGWRAGYIMEALLVLFVALPAVYFWIGRSHEHEVRDTATSSAGLPSWGDLLSNRRIWLLCIGAGLGYAPATSIMSQFQPLLMTKGITAESAAALVGVAGIASLLGALVTGSLVDRYWAPGIAFLFACGSAVGSSMLALNAPIEGPIAWGAVLLIGFGLGAEIDVVAYMVARYFGVKSFASFYGLAIFFMAACGAIGASLLAMAFDHYGNYDLALFVIAGCFITAGCTYLLMGRYPREDD
ncbi:MFS transporter [Sphingobium fuliginis]|uniref:Major facilitator superfamily MFS_1 n=1 Tax=Sphingobium fuliginis (strain ATCC 27551) TaxID=336203 RepID=A0A292ZAJ1_SPHSA|nr:MFS transporter [Sphingobium fuliginis]GAY21742.1 major facilitator superfamily MFS_1 [Sphingobium fuliginis]